MDWANERYVRLYTRDTLTWKLLSWQARALFALLLRKVDRSGVIAVGDHGARGVAAVAEMPIEVAEPALSELVREQVVEVGDGCIVLPKFIEAQETPQTDAQRKRESRARNRDLARGSVTKPDNESRNVTDGHETSRNRPVDPECRTKSHSEPSQAKPCESARAPARSAEDGPALACGTDPGGLHATRDPLKTIAETLFQEIEDGKARLRSAGVQNGTRPYGGLPPWGAIKPIHELVVEFGEDRIRHHVAVELADAKLRGDGGFLSSMWTAKRVLNSSSREPGQPLGPNVLGRKPDPAEDPDSMEAVLDRLGGSR